MAISQIYSDHSSHDQRSSKQRTAIFIPQQLRKLSV